MPFKKIIVMVVGGTILVFGLALLVLPGPAFVVIPIGLAVLATEFVWARRWLRRAKGMVNRRKAHRTTRAVWITCQRKWEQLRSRLLRVIKPSSPVRATPQPPEAEKTALPPSALAAAESEPSAPLTDVSLPPPGPETRTSPTTRPR